MNNSPIQTSHHQRWKLGLCGFAVGLVLLSVAASGQTTSTDSGDLPTGCLNDPPTEPANPDDPVSKEPVDLASGVYKYYHTDLTIPGLMPLVFQRVYRSENNGSPGRLGVGWTDSYDYRIRADGGDLSFALPTNDRYLFVKQADGSYINTNEYWLAGAVLYDSGGYNSEAAYTLRFKDGTRFVFGYTYYGEEVSWPYFMLTYIIDRNGNETHIVTDAGALVEIDQPSGRSLYVTDDYIDAAKGRVYIAQITDNMGRSVTYGYDTDEPPHLKQVMDPMGGITTYGYDSDGDSLRTITLPNQVQFVENVYDSSNRVKKQVLADGGTNTFIYTVDTNKVVTQTVMRNPLGNSTTYSFSNGWNTSVMDALGNTTTFIRNMNNGAVTSVIDPLGRTNSYLYDANNNLIAVTNAQNKVTTSTYEPVFNQLTSVTDPLGHTTSFGYDQYGNQTSITNALGKVTTTTYNSYGEPLTITDPMGNTQTFTYNETLDLSSVTDPLSNTVQRFVDVVGRTYEVIDPLGRATTTTYDLLDRVTQITDPRSGTTSFGFDSVGNLTNVTDALNHTVTYGYDAMNQLTNRVDQLGKAETYAYDKEGNVTNFVDRRGVPISYLYDALDRRTGTVYGTESSVQVFYDSVGRKTNIVDSIAGSTRLAYDSLNRLMQVLDIKGTITYGYNDAGLRTNMTVAGQNPVAYLYDTVNRLTNAMQGSFTTSLTYNDDGLRTELVLPNGMNVLYAYDADTRVTNITYQGAVTNQIAYAYDQTGKRTARGSALASYNLPSAISASTHDGANRQLSFGAHTMLYDANGNVTNIVNSADGSTRSLVWNARNQLTAMSDAVTASFAYDGLGRRISRTVNGTTENYLYDGADIIQQLDGSGTVGANYFRGLTIDEPWMRSDVGAVTTNRVYLADALGSIIALADNSQYIRTAYTYDPFGVTTTIGAANKNSYGFTGRENDGSGLYYYRARYYHPALGRFVSEDPIGYGGGVDFYAYALNSSLDYADPLGVSVASSIGGWIWNHSNVQGTFNAGNGVFGVTVQVTITPSGVSITPGVGWGVGMGGSITVGGTVGTGQNTGWNFSGSVSGGDALGGQATSSVYFNDSAITGGYFSGGFGLGLGAGGSATLGYTIPIDLSDLFGGDDPGNYNSAPTCPSK
jgi:RHS repeat-associated protein